MNRWQIGDVKITRVVELETVSKGTFVLPDATPENIQREGKWMIPHFADENGRLRMSIHALVLESEGRRIVVDTCIGNDKRRDFPGWNMLQTSFLSDLENAGFPRDSIDLVLCTHLHVDHVGWNTMLVDGKWVPTFPRARYLMGRTEYEHWSTNQSRPDMQLILEDSVTPILDAGLATLVETDHVLCDEVSLVPTIGHTPGHCSVRIVSGGEEALITGDFMHHPCQIAHPEWATLADSDPDQGIRTRLAMFEKLAGGPVLVIGTHFAGATAGRIVRDGDGYRLDV